MFSWGSMDIRDVQVELLDKYGLIRVHYGSYRYGRVKKKEVILITLGSDPPLKSDNHYFGN